VCVRVCVLHEMKAKQRSCQRLCMRACIYGNHSAVANRKGSSLCAAQSMANVDVADRGSCHDTSDHCAGGSVEPPRPNGGTEGDGNRTLSRHMPWTEMPSEQPVTASSNETTESSFVLRKYRKSDCEPEGVRRAASKTPRRRAKRQHARVAMKRLDLLELESDLKRKQKSSDYDGVGGMSSIASARFLL